MKPWELVPNFKSVEAIEEDISRDVNVCDLTGQNGRGQRSWSSLRTQRRAPLWFVGKYMMPLCPGLYSSRTSICNPHLCDQWARTVVTGPVWQIDHDESQGWKPGSVTAGPGQARDDADPGKQRALWTALASALGPPSAPPLPLSTSCLCHSTSKSNPWSKAKEKKGEEKREETEKWKGRGRLTCVLGGKGERTTNRSLSDGGGSCSGRGTCVPAASQADAKLRPCAR